MAEKSLKIMPFHHQETNLLLSTKQVSSCYPSPDKARIYGTRRTLLDYVVDSMMAGMERRSRKLRLRGLLYRHIRERCSVIGRYLSLVLKDLSIYMRSLQGDDWGR